MKSDGLERNRWVEPIEDFVRMHGHGAPRWAVCLSYEFEPALFNLKVLPVLSRQGRCFRTVVLTDAGALEKRFTTSQPPLSGAVNLHPVRCIKRGVFHPKLVLLRAGQKVRVCFGSANLTSGGFGGNLELWSHSDSSEIVAGIVHFLETLSRSRNLLVDEGARRSLKYALAGLVGAESDSVWSSLNGSFAERLRRGRESRATEVVVISPMFSGKKGVSDARGAIAPHKLRLYTDASAKIPRCDGLFLYSPAEVSDDGAEEDKKTMPSGLHAKAYIFRQRRGGTSTAWLGSANFTAQALAKSIVGGGNLELMVRTVLPDDEVRALEADLNELFKSCRQEGDDRRKADVPTKAQATVLAGELRGKPGGWKLVLETTQRNGQIRLRQDEATLLVPVRRGRGIVRGSKLERLIPQLESPDAPQTIVLFQVLPGGKEVPIIVNVPHVPPDDEEGSPQAKLDWMLDELLGRVRVIRRQAGHDEDFEQLGGSEDMSEDDDAETEDELGRSLDLVRHQGELDQLAVKIATFKKLLARVASGEERNRMLDALAPTALSATPKHLKSAVKAHLGLRT